MFGTVVCNKKELTKEEQAKYQGVYCGLCRALKNRYGHRQATCVRKNLERLSVLEKSNTALLDEVVNCSGRMLSEIFVYIEDFWSEALRKFANCRRCRNYKK